MVAKLTIACGLICLFLGSYQILNMIEDFFAKNKGTEVQILSAAEAFRLNADPDDDENPKLPILYCAADWIDLKKMEHHDLEMKHAFYLAYWMEVLSGEHGRLEGEQQTWREPNKRPYDPNFDNHRTEIDSGLRRTLYHLQTMESQSTEWWVFDGMKKFANTMHNTQMSMEENAAFNYEDPGELDGLMELHQSLEDKFGPLNADNARRMLIDLSFNPLINETNPEIEIRYGQVCHRIALSPGTNMEVLVKKQMTVRAEMMPNQKMYKEKVEKHAVVPAGVHLSAYTGGMVPVFGGDDANQYRTSSAIPCFTGGYIICRDPTGRAPVQQYFTFNSVAINCGNICVDKGHEVDSLWELIYIDIDRKCRQESFCNEIMNRMPNINQKTKRNGMTSDGLYQSGCGSYFSPLCTVSKCLAVPEVTGGACANLTARKEQLHLMWNIHEHLLPSMVNERCPAYTAYNVTNTPIPFGQRMTTSVYTMSTKIYKRLSTASSPCIDNSASPDAQPMYQRSAKCAAICRDEILFPNCTLTALLFVDEGHQLDRSLPLCDVAQFWLGIRSLRDPEKTTKSAELQECESKCRIIPPLCRTITASLTPGSEMHQKYTTEQPYNYHKLMINAVEIEVTSEFPQLPWDSFVANLGGLFGFFLGMSLFQWCLWPFELYVYVKDKWIKKRRNPKSAGAKP